MSEIKLCFVPHAGGSAMGYTNFRKFLSSDIKPAALEPAGRGKRISEKCFTDAYECAQDLFDKNREIFEDGNYAFFGHSLGTVLSFELAKIIKKNGLPGPVHMFFSGRYAPHSGDGPFIKGIGQMSDEDFLNAFSVFGAIPDIILKNEEMMKMILPVMRSDVIMAESYHPEYSGPELSCDITVLYGLSDNCYSGQGIEMWQECTTGKCNSAGFTGDHFYFNNPENKQQLCDLINRTLLG